MRRGAVLGLAMGFLAACTADLPVHPAGSQFMLDREAVLDHLANPTNFDWSYRRATTLAADRRRARSNSALERQLQAVTSNTTSTAGVASNISSAPAYDTYAKRCYWITNGGVLLSYNIGSGGAPTLFGSWQVKNSGGTNQAFANTSVTLSSDSKRVYLVSTTGEFLAISTANGACLYSVSMGANNNFTNAGTNVPPNTCPAPFIDPLASRPDGQEETVYAISNQSAGGTKLYRMIVNAPRTGTATYGNQAYTIPVGATEGARVSPVVVGGKALIGTWVQNASPPDTGYMRYYNTGVPSFTTSTASAGAVISAIALNAPVFASPAVDFNDAFTPFLAFVPSAETVTMIDIAGGTTAQSVPLLVDQATPPTTYPQIQLNGSTVNTAIQPPQSLDNYPYVTGSQTVTIQPDSIAGPKYCSVTVAEDNSMALTPTPAAAPNYLDFGDFYAWRTNDASVDPTPYKSAYGYLRFTIPNSAVYVAGESVPRGVKACNVQMKCQVASNAAGAGGYPSFEGWVLSNNLNGTTTMWDPSNITATNRPHFANGDAFTDGGNFPTSVLASAHDSEKLSPNPANNSGSSFASTGGGGPYWWSALGLMTVGATTTVGFYDDLDNVASGGHDNGKPHNVGAPHFDNASNRPFLNLTLASLGTSATAMFVPLAIDTETEQVWAVNCNALFRVDYQSYTYTGANRYNAASLTERKAVLADPKHTFYAMTRLGATGGTTNGGPFYTASTAPTSRFTGNFTAPMLTPTRVYVMDNAMTSSSLPFQTTVNEFSFGTPPTSTLNSGSAPVLQSFLDLKATAGDAQGPPPYMCYDYETTRVFTATYQPGTATGRIWVLDR